MSPRPQPLSRLSAVLSAWVLGVLCASRTVALTAGDVAIIAVNGDAPESFAWVSLVDIPANTLLKFTDASFGNAGTNYFRYTEGLDGNGPLTWTYANPLPRGTVVKWDETAGVTNWTRGTQGGIDPDFSVSGDQIFIFTGSIVSNAPAGYSPYVGDPSGATMLIGFNWGTSAWQTSGAGDTSSSYVPTGTAGIQLSTASNTAIQGHFSLDNIYYTGPAKGTRDQLLKWMNVSTNWLGSNTATNTLNWRTNLTVLDGFQVTTNGQKLTMAATNSSGGKGSTMRVLDSSPMPSNSEVMVAFKTTNSPTFSSDILDFQGTGTNTCVLQLSYDPTGLSLSQEQHLALGWFNPTSNEWMNAVLGNLGGTPLAVLGAWNASYGLGTYGVDTDQNVVWAVVNHNSEFAAIPEPSLAGLVLASAALLLGVLRSRGPAPRA